MNLSVNCSFSRSGERHCSNRLTWDASAFIEPPTSPRKERSDHESALPIDFAC